MYFNGEPITAFFAGYQYNPKDAIEETVRQMESKFASCIVPSAKGTTIAIKDSADAPFRGLRIFGQVVGDGCIGDKGNIAVEFGGKNLFHHRLDLEPNGNTNATLLEVLDNGVILQGGNGTGTGSSAWSNGWYVPAFDWGKQVPLKKGDVVTISADFTLLEYAHSLPARIGIFLDGAASHTDGALYPVSEIGVATRIRTTYTTIADGNYRTTFTTNSGKVKIENIQVEYGAAATEYKPYVEPQTLTVPTPGGLEGDEHAQDEIDFGKGVLIRRVVENSETPLPVEVLDAFAQLHTYNGGITITNDEAAEMAVEYVADTKAYIDNKINELATAIVALG